VQQLLDRLRDNPWLSADEVLAELSDEPVRAAALTAVMGAAGNVADAVARARLLRLAARLAGSLGDSHTRQAEELELQALAAVGAAVQSDFSLPSSPPKTQLVPDQTVWTTAPVRLDFAGGWSDTPPICNEFGGAVVNGAITLNGRAPCQAVARMTTEPTLRITSIDLGRSITLTEPVTLEELANPRDWATIAKAALVLTGLCPSNASADMNAWLDGFGGGVDLTIFSGVPKGSGLGTSSVLGAALLACLGRVVGPELPFPELTRRTSILEQMMATGGGWQDQAGGAAPGVKLVATEPGGNQVPTVTPIPLSDEAMAEFHERALLYYTGYQRLAANILQKVVGRFLDRDPEMRDIVTNLKAGALRMQEDLSRGDLDAFGAGTLDYWELKKRIDEGSTTEQIERILAPVAPLLSGYGLAGAGGGGFMFLFGKDAISTRRVRSHMLASPPNQLARFFDVALDPHGLHLTVM
jgi:fucokinase / fucose-1-phosphate guanylyltransferase